MIRNIQIRPVLNGFVCEVGCQTVVFETRERLLATLGRYLVDPDGVEKEFALTAVNPTPGMAFTYGDAERAPTMPPPGSSWTSGPR